MMEELKVNEKWAVQPDEYCYVLKEYKKNTNEKSDNYGKIYVTHRTYHLKLKDVLEHIREEEAKVNLNYLDKFIEIMNELDQKFENMFKDKN